MALEIKNNWQFSFHYEQDLRSKYMNHILSGVLQPGIYNAGIELVHYQAPISSEEDSTKVNGWYLFIKKGTTFVFRNGYKVVDADSTITIIRDLDSLGSYTIKCTAQEDMYSPILAPTATTSSGSSPINIDLSNRFVVAKVAYDEEESTGFIAPSFSLVTANEAGTGFNELSRDVSEYSIPDGRTSISGSKVSWLMIGRLNLVHLDKDNNISGNFVARGLPEYTSPSMIERSSMSGISLTSSDVYSSKVYSSEATCYLPVPILHNVWVDNDIYSLNDDPSLINALYKMYDGASFSDAASLEGKITLESIPSGENGILIGFLYKDSAGLKFSYRVLNPNILSEDAQKMVSSLKDGTTSEDNKTSIRLDIDRRNIEKFVGAIQNSGIVSKLVDSIRNEISNNNYPISSTVIAPLYIANCVNGCINPSEILDLTDIQRGRNHLSHLVYSTPQYLSTINVLND